MEYGVIGEHLTHSFSKEIHNLITDYTYEIREIPKEQLGKFMEEHPFRAINVTIPYKQDVIPYLSFISPQAEAIHAVNTIVNRDGKLYGYNTDYFGLSSLIKKIGINLTNKKVLILGTGGTSLTARLIAKDANAKVVYRVSRAPKEDDCISYEQATALHNDSQVIINTTPCGMYPNIDGIPIDITKFPNLEGVVDAIYNPLRSRLVLKAKELGVPAQGGLYMLVAQAVQAVEHFIDTTLPDEVIEKVYQQLVYQKENVVLVGMPGCGKTTIGKLLAQKLNRPFVDMDDEIVKEIGCSISDYFEANGEKAFRDIETKIATERIGPMNGAIIATGGGAVLRDENVDALRTNGRLYFIDRPLEQLVATGDRPTANTFDRMKKRYEERYHRYCNVCDIHIHSYGVAQTVANEIAKDFIV